MNLISRAFEKLMSWIICRGDHSPFRDPVTGKAVCGRCGERLGVVS